MKKIFPTYNNKNIKFLYLYTLTYNAWFILPNWVFLFSQHLSLKEIGFIEGIALLIGWFAEIPSGVIADKFGRKITLLIGNALLFISSFIILQATSFNLFFLAQIIMWIGFAFISGANEALIYDSLLAKKQEKKYDSVISKTNFISTVMLILTVFLGGLLFSIGPKLPYVAWMVFSILSMIVLLFITEPKINSHHINENYFKHIKSGFGILFSKKLSKIITPIILLTMLAFSYQGIVRQSMGSYFGYTGETFGYLISFILLPTTIISYKFDKIKRYFGDKKLLLISHTLYLLAFIFAIISNNMIAGAIVFLLIYSSEKLFKPLSSIIVNDNIQSSKRATVLSTLTFVGQIPYVILLSFFIFLAEKENMPILFSLFLALISISFIISIKYFKNETPTK